MPCTVTVLYPGGEGKNFDIDYYKNTHMPMVMSELKPYGMTGEPLSQPPSTLHLLSTDSSLAHPHSRTSSGYKITTVTGTPDPNTPSPYQTVCLMYYESSKGFTEGLGATSEKLLGDIPNFTNTQPALLIGEDVDSK